jgi:hypothetical protein
MANAKTSTIIHQIASGLEIMELEANNPTLVHGKIGPMNLENSVGI